MNVLQRWLLKLVCVCVCVCVCVLVFVLVLGLVSGFRYSKLEARSSNVEP